MCSPPTWLLVEPFFVSLNTVPALIVRAVVLAQRLDHVRGFAVTAFAAMHNEVFDTHLFNLASFYYVLLFDDRQSSTRLTFQNAAI
jgi:hypothetical protein